jgi:ABC-2 type transport system ATP-binding protein
MIMNILFPDSGTIRVFGDEMRGASTDRIGYLPEERGLYKKMKVRDLLRFFGELKSGRKVNQQVDAWLDRLDLGGWAGKKIETLSKGMAQKVQFIAAVVAEPELIILDEPFTGLDPLNLEVIKNAVLELRGRGATVLFSTHDMNVAEKMCDFIFMIFKGRKVLDGTLAAIQDQYGNDTLRLRAEGGMSRLNGLAGVEKAIDFGRLQELRMRPGSDPQQVLAEIMSRTPVYSFEVAKPTLYDIFLRIAGEEARNRDDA